MCLSILASLQRCALRCLIYLYRNLLPTVLQVRELEATRNDMGLQLQQWQSHSEFLKADMSRLSSILSQKDRQIQQLNQYVGFLNNCYTNSYMCQSFQ
jgi:hypothetical protein